LSRTLAVTCVLLAACGLFAFDLRRERSGEIITDSYRSEPLGKSIGYSIYVPHGARGGAGGIVYLFHGAGGAPRDWIDKGDLPTIVDRRLSANAIPPAIFVMPDMSGCWWIDSSRCAFETFFRQEFDPFIRRKYAQAEGDAVKRYVVGVSIGGFAAIRLALTSPGFFVGVAALSPAIYRNQPPAFSALMHDTPFEDAAGHFDLPFWRAINYTGTLGPYAKQRARSTFLIDVGSEDPLGAVDEAVAFHQALASVTDQRSSLQISNGGHDWIFWRSVLPLALESLLRPDSNRSVGCVLETKPVC
jgi:S-formylglutathione hydrolase FrmB